MVIWLFMCKNTPFLDMHKGLLFLKSGVSYQFLTSKNTIRLNQFLVECMLMIMSSASNLGYSSCWDIAMGIFCSGINFIVKYAKIKWWKILLNCKKKSCLCYPAFLVQWECWHSLQYGIEFHKESITLNL